MPIELNGYHGTSLDAAKTIIEKGYKKSFGDKEWLGDGVYFFIKGMSSEPKEQAKKWAIVSAWNNHDKKNDYSEYCVIHSLINVEESNLLDLRIEDGVELLDYLYEKFEEKIKSIGIRLKLIDGLLINLARNEGILAIDVAIGNFYIKFAKERIKNINLRTANCTICTVFEPNKNISKSNIVEIADIKSETY